MLSRPKRGGVKILAPLALLLALSGCGASCPYYPSLALFAHQAYYDRPDRTPFFAPLPPNVWARNSYLESALERAIDKGGIEKLAEYSLQCTPRPARGDCTDCYTCSETAPLLYTDTWLLKTICSSEGDMMIRAEIGPGSAVSAMTFWKKP